MAIQQMWQLYVHACYYSFRLNEDWRIQYPYLKDWFNKLHERESVKSTIPKKLDT
jgi:glutathione S-transferase